MPDGNGTFYDVIAPTRSDFTPVLARRNISFAVGARLPTSFINADYVRAGGLMSYGPSYPTLFRRAAEIADKILHGAKPADIPVEQPSKFEFVVNMKTAKSLGLTIPDKMLALADEVVE